MSSVENQHPSRQGFDLVWRCVVEPVILAFRAKYEISRKDNAKELVWKNYVSFNRACRSRYMLNPDGLLDRHKVCACYMFAILASDILSLDGFETPAEGTYVVVNEHLAITVGMTLLRSFIISSVQNSQDFDEQKKLELIARVDDGIHFPETNHGTYHSNFASELYFTKKENNYNILSLANTLYLLEVYSLGCDHTTSLD